VSDLPMQAMHVCRVRQFGMTEIACRVADRASKREWGQTNDMGAGSDRPSSPTIPGGMHFMASATRAVLVAATGFTIVLGGCADPCFDDGLAQGGCPSAETDSATDASTVTESNSMSGATESETLSTMSGGSNTETVTDTEVVTDSAGECPSLMELLEPEVPTFQIVVDQSGSMEEMFGTVTRWEAMRTTLVGMNAGVVTDLQAEIRFGLSLYNNPQGDGPCPVVDTLAPQLDARDQIITVLDASGPEGDTPTGESLDLALQTLMEDTFDGPKFILLATDGEPDTCAIANPENDQEREMVRNRVITAVEAAYEGDVRTFVISVGSEIGEEHLQQVANAGAGVGDGDPDAAFYVALNQDELLDAFRTIVSGLRNCRLELPSELMEEYASTCQVTINDAAYPYDDPNGWELDDPTHIELLGNACSAIQDGTVSIEMNCTCE
jgi:hypothetical protein